MYLFWTIATALAFTLGGACMKASSGMTELGPTLLLYVCFAAGATFQALALRKSELGVAYMFSLGLEAVLVFGLGQVFFAESVSVGKVVGVASIIVGIILIHREAPTKTAEVEADPAQPASSAVEMEVSKEGAPAVCSVATRANYPDLAVNPWLASKKRMPFGNAPPTGPPGKCTSRLNDGSILETKSQLPARHSCRRAASFLKPLPPRFGSFR
jgi:multidrug transporter EmrE-like cation transporter